MHAVSEHSTSRITVRSNVLFAKVFTAHQRQTPRLLCPKFPLLFTTASYLSLPREHVNIVPSVRHSLGPTLIPYLRGTGKQKSLGVKLTPTSTVFKVSYARRRADLAHSYDNCKNKF